MRRQILALSLASVFGGGCANLPLPVPGSPSGTGTGGGPRPPSTASVAADVIAHTNDARRRNGLPALATNARLMEAARMHAQQMAAYERAEHTISGARYPTMQSRLDAVGYRYANVAENVAWNQQDARSVLNTWMNSAGHRANILDSELTEIGAAMARSSRGEPYWIQVFGTPR